MNIKELLVKKLVKKKALSVWAAVIISILIIGAALYYSNLRNDIKIDAHRELETICKLKVRQIERWYNERKDDLEIVSQSMILVQRLEEWFANRNDTLIRNSIRDRIEIIRKSKDYKNIFIVSTQGKVLLSLDKDHEFESFSESELLKQSIDHQKIIVSDIFFCSIENDIQMDYIAPIFNRQNEIVALFIFRLDPKEYLFPLVEQWPIYSKSAETVLVKQMDDSVQFLNSLRHLQNNPLDLKVSLKDVNVPAVQAVLGSKGVYEGVDYRNTEVISYLSEIPGTNWFLISKIDKSEVYAELNYRVVTLITFLLSLIFLTAVGFAWIYSIDKEKVYRQLFIREKEFTKSLMQFKTILYSIGDAVITTDKAGIVQQLNPVAERMTGWTEEAARGRNFDEVIQLINESSGELIENLVSKVLQKESIIEFSNHTFLKSKTQNEIPIASGGAPIIDEHNEIIGVVLVFRDQTFKYNTEKALRESESRYKGIYENAAIGIYQIDKGGNLILANPAFLKMIGVNTFNDIKGKALIRKGFASIESRARYKSILDEKGIIIDYEDKWKRTDGKEIYVLESARAIHDENNELIFYEGVVLDITELKLATKELTSARDKAIAMEKIKSEFLAQMSHEIRTPLNAMLSTIDYVRDEVKDKLSFDAQTVFNIIDNSGKRIIDTIQSILNMSELQSGSYEIIKSKFDLVADIINPVIDLYVQRIVEKKVKLKFEKPDEDFILQSDFYSTEQIFKNIFDNAVKFTKQGSITVRLSKVKSHFELAIIDTGIGISPEYLSKIFDPFTQEYQGYSRPYDGCGLGLAITRKYCELDNIELKIDSIRGKGTEVTLIFKNSDLL